jgi:murein DD-endopeptidase MepM/ murein hydrolase activator NlpD
MGKKNDNFGDASAKARDEEPPMTLTYEDTKRAFEQGTRNAVRSASQQPRYGWGGSYNPGASDEAISMIREQSAKRGMGDYTVIHTPPTTVSSNFGLRQNEMFKSELMHRGAKIGEVTWHPNGTVNVVHVKQGHGHALGRFISASWDFAESMGAKGPQGGHLQSANVMKMTKKANKRAARDNK